MCQIQPRSQTDPFTYYATGADFCEVLEKEMEPLYLLAFLLTASHQAAEQCLVAAVEESYEQHTVFKQWVRAWIKRRIIKKAIHGSLADATRAHGKSDLWWERQDGSRLTEIDCVACMPTFDRFVFVLSALEGYSIRNCSVLLNCSAEQVLQSRIAASRQLSLPSSLSMNSLVKLTNPLNRVAISAA